MRWSASSGLDRRAVRLTAVCSSSKHNPDSAEAHCNLGMAYYHLGDLDDAVRAFQRAIELDETPGYAHVAEANPNDAAAHYHLGPNDKHKGLDDLAIGAMRCGSIRPTAPRRRSWPRSSVERPDGVSRRDSRRGACSDRR